MNSRVVAVIIFLVTNFRLCQGKRYDNYTLYRVIPTVIDHLKFLQNLEKQKYMDVVFWKKPYKLYEEVQFIVNPNDKDLFLERTRHYEIDVEVMIQNVQEAFEGQSIVHHYLRFKTDTYSWDNYHTLDDIYQWLQDIATQYQAVVELQAIGKSVENREIYSLSIGRDPYKKTVIVEGGMHGCEWISTEFVTYLADHLLHANSSKDPRLVEVANNYQWFLVPVANPDGYEYSHKVDRLWRKNRRRYGNDYGVDLNRNFDYNFGSHGISKNPADETYCGPLSFSEPETKAFSNFVSINSNDLHFYFSIHAYGQKIIIPYGDRILHVDNFGEMENFGKQAVMKMYRKHGVKYAVGTTYDTLGKLASFVYVNGVIATLLISRKYFIHVSINSISFDAGTRISGNSDSWVKKTFNVKYVFAFLLRDNGSYGYALPPNQIRPTCEEALTGLLEIMTASPRRVRANVFGSSAEHVRAGALVLFILLFLGCLNKE